MAGAGCVDDRDASLEEGEWGLKATAGEVRGHSSCVAHTTPSKALCCRAPEEMGI